MSIGFASIDPKVKPRYDLIPTLALEQCAMGFTQGEAVHGYSDDNYLTVSDAKLEGAIMRHLQEYRKGNPIDPETGVHHLACAANNALMLLEKTLRTE